MPDNQTVDELESTVTCTAEVNASSGYAEELALKAQPRQRFGTQILEFFTSLGIPDTQLDLFSNVCTSTQRNTMENPGEVECPEDETSSPPITPATIALLFVVIIAGAVVVVYGRTVFNLLRALSPV